MITRPQLRTAQVSGAIVGLTVGAALLLAYFKEQLLRAEVLFRIQKSADGDLALGESAAIPSP